MNWKTRHYCGDITTEHIGQSIDIMGWVDATRDHGHLLFIHIRDIRGIIQVVFDPEESPEVTDLAHSLRSEFCVHINGTIQQRSEDTINPNIPTGTLELRASTLTILNKAQTPPFILSEKDMLGDSVDTHYVDEDIRLKYRYLDLRRLSVRSNLIKRSQLIKEIRDHLSEFNFLDIETPVLTKSTPEGARDYLVPSRPHEGKFYALPQSPQLFKQLLMVSGMDRYYQIVKCFRDEDLRPNRQPEFTQLDLEASFIDEEFIYDLLEGLITRLFKSQGIVLQTPFPRLGYDEAISTYGTDAPDLRFDMPLVDVTDILPNSGYKIFNTIVSKGGLIKGMRIPGQAEHLSKNVLQNEFAMNLIQKFGGKGMTWMKLEKGEFQSNIVQFFTLEELTQLKERLQGENGDVLVFVADTDHHLVNTVLGKFRSFIADRQGLIPQNTFSPCWVTDFPMFELKDGVLSSMHHPFTQPNEPLSKETSKEVLLALKARAYDVVINGEEIGGGSIRVHNQNTQQSIFDALGLSPEETQEKFGFFLEALQYGTPPHGGIALGIDRLVSMICGTDSIRDVIAFPKNRVAYCPLTQAPSSVDSDQLDDLHLKLKIIAPEKKIVK